SWLELDLRNVVKARHLRPMRRQHAPAERVDLAEGDRLEPPGPLEAKREAADAAEEVHDTLHAPSPSISTRAHSGTSIPMRYGFSRASLAHWYSGVVERAWARR